MPTKFQRQKRPRASFARKPFRKSDRFQQAHKKMGLTTMKLSVIETLDTSVSGVFDEWFILNRIRSINLGGTDVQDLANIQALYTMYKVNAVRVKFIPQFPNDTSVTTGYFPLYAVVDYDDPTTALASTGEAVENPRFKAKNLYRPWTLYFKSKDYGGKSGFRSNTLGAGPDGYMRLDNTTSANDIGAALKFYATGLDVSTTYGRLIFTYYVSLKNRQ